jgi:long-chain acyl-CoA synthetase
MNAAEPLARSARHLPTAPAILFEGRAITYRQLLDQVVRAAAGLLAQGVQPGDRVALMLPNIPAFIVAYEACQWIGAISVSLNVMLTTDELRYVLQDSGTHVVFTTERLFGALAPLVDEGIVRLDRVVCCEGAIAHTASLNELGAGIPTPPLRKSEPTDAAAILYTSGTTGRQKGATLSVGNIAFNTSMTRHYLRIAPSDRLLLFLPLFHVFGQDFIMHSAFASGAAVVLHQRYDPEAILVSIQQDGVTMFFAVPTIYIGMLTAGVPLQRMRSVRYFFSAAATMPEEIAQRWREAYDRPIFEGYGLTETSPFASYNHEWEYRPGSVGTAVDATELRIVDPDDREVSSGTWGEICMRGPHVMLGYWNRPAESADVLRGGWFHSGDVGYMDDDGYVYIVDRTKDMINSAGFKIWPREVEEVLYQHPAVAECAVYAAPDPLKGEVAEAAVVLRGGSAVSAEDLEAYCRAHLAAYKTPRAFEFVASLPKSATGKILKRELRSRAARPAR